MGCIPTSEFHLDEGILAEAWTNEPHVPIFGNSQHLMNSQTPNGTHGV